MAARLKARAIAQLILMLISSVISPLWLMLSWVRCSPVEAAMLKQDQHELIDLGAATDVTQGVYFPPLEEQIGTPDHFDA